jgi:hypothetical protein
MKKVILVGLGLLVLCCVKLYFFPFQNNTDYGTYIETSKLFAGDNNAEVYGFRILKPLAPTINAFMSIFVGHEMGFYVMVIIGFLAYAFFSIRLYQVIFSDIKECAWIAWVLGITSYPMMRYGLDSYTETGAWALYVAGLYYTYLFYKAPSIRLAMINTAVFCLGFFWKEYTSINIIIFAFVSLLLIKSTWKEKLVYSTAAGSVFVVVNTVYQVLVYSYINYTYLDWFAMGAEGYKTEYTIFNFSKSMFALLMLGWAFVPTGIFCMFKEHKSYRWFVTVSIACSGLFLLWGWVSSRLYFVSAPILFGVAAYGIVRLIPHVQTRRFVVSLLVLIQVSYTVISLS